MATMAVMFSHRFRRIWALLCAALCLAGCEPKPGSSDSTKLYVQALLKRMERFGPVHKISDRTSIISNDEALRMIVFSVPAKNFPPARLNGEMAATFNEVEDGKSTYGTQGGSGQDYGFEIRYGDAQGDAYIGGQAIPRGEQMEIEIKIITAKERAVR